MDWLNGLVDPFKVAWMTGSNAIKDATLGVGTFNKNVTPYTPEELELLRKYPFAANTGKAIAQEIALLPTEIGGGLVGTFASPAGTIAGILAGRTVPGAYFDYASSTGDQLRRNPKITDEELRKQVLSDTANGIIYNSIPFGKLGKATGFVLDATN